MAKDEKFVEKFMHATDKLRGVFGPADQGDIDAPVIHRHDPIEDESEDQMRHLEFHTDSQGQRYAEWKTTPPEK